METMKIVSFISKDSLKKIGEIEQSMTTRFLTIDPMARKYPEMNPYGYCANNPILFKDPNGEEIWIYYDDKEGNQQKLQYTAGMEYQGDNAFVTSTVNYLNTMNDVEAGANVLSSLINSDNTFDFSNTASSGGDRTFQLDYRSNYKYKEGGAVIHAAAFMNTDIEDVQNVESAAHELFHGYQRENGQNPATINGEVGAYLFGRGVASNSAYGSPLMLGFGNETTVGQAYNNAMFNMMYGFDKNHSTNYQNAITNFHKGASVNNYGNGLYRNHKIDPKYKPLILKFLPLIK
jgi:hypothetical protein